MSFIFSFSLGLTQIELQNLPELRTFVIEAAIGMDLNVALVANPGMDCKKHDFTQPVVTSIADVVWAGEKVMTLI